eukprot:scaffold9728_cov132-Isochrysis_galbana.AAC.5
MGDPSRYPSEIRTARHPVSRAWFTRRSRDASDRARRRFVSSRFIQFMYNLRFDTVLSEPAAKRTIPHLAQH